MENTAKTLGETTSAPEKAPQPPAPTADPNKKPFVSAGQHIHKWGTYFSVDWFFNAAVGVAFYYGTKYTHFGQKYWSAPIQGFFKNILKPLIKDEEALGKSAGKGGTFMSIIAGGMFTMPPLMVLEDKKNRISISKWLDETIHGKEAVANDPKFEASYKAIAEEPEKEFWTGMGARFTALAPLLAFVLVPAHQPGEPRKWFHPISDVAGKFFGTVADGSKWVAKKIGFSEKSFKPGITIENGEFKAVDAKYKWNDTHDAIAMDFGLDLPYAFLHSVLFGAFTLGKTKDKSATTANHPVTSEPSKPSHEPSSRKHDKEKPESTVTTVRAHEKHVPVELEVATVR
jgi:hypothetical protein